MLLRTFLAVLVLILLWQALGPKKFNSDPNDYDSRGFKIR